MAARPIFQIVPGRATEARIRRALSGGVGCVKFSEAQFIPLVRGLGAKAWLRPFSASGPSDDGLGVDPARNAHDVATMCRNAGAWPDMISPRNEVGDAPYVGEWAASFTYELRSEGCPSWCRILLPSFQQGVPDPGPMRAIWQTYIDKHPDHFSPEGVDDHGYTDMTIAAGWPYHIGRGTWLLEQGAIPRGTYMASGEGFIDSVTRGAGDNTPLEDPKRRTGWLDDGKLTAAQFLAQLAGYLPRLAPEYEYVAIFADGIDDDPSSQWYPYRVWGTDAEPGVRQYWQGAQPVAPIVGIDVSTFQVDPQDPQPVDWAKVAASGRQFAYCKATEGTGYVDPQIAHNWPGIRAAGLARGAYHYARFDLGNRPEDEAAYFLAHVGTWQPGDTFILDIEQQTSLSDLSGWVRGWLDAVAARTGARKIVYSYASFLEQHNLTQASLGADVSLILAAYQAVRPAVPVGWGRYAMWQHADDAAVPGVQLACDEDYLEVSLDAWRALGVPGGTDVDQQAQTYFFQDGFKVPTQNALWTVALEPLYAFWQQLKAQGSPLADLVAPGPLKSGETPATWGQGRPASVAKLTNREVGVYQDAQGVWRPYQAEIF